jgi:IMP dehydrogenase
MELFFKGYEMSSRGRGLTFDDVLLVPNHSEINSRHVPSLASAMTKNFKTSLPLISANMDTITESKMAEAMASLGGMGIIHRFMSIEAQITEVGLVKKFQAENKLHTPLAASIGVKEEDRQRARLLVEAGVEILTIDIAHGDSIMMIEMLSFIKKAFPQIDVIAGNVATASAVRKLVDYGADAIKVGIGPGSMCTTRIITGCGVPQLTAIATCAAEAKRYDVPLIADGGLRTSGDIVKALCAGASSVMLGSMLSGCLETPGEMHNGEKRYRGMASKEAQVSWRGELPVGMAPEGVSTLIPCKGSVKDLVHEICGGIRSGMTYLNAHTLGEMAELTYFVEISNAGVKESGPHGVHSSR